MGTDKEKKDKDWGGVYINLFITVGEIFYLKTVDHGLYDTNFQIFSFQARILPCSLSRYKCINVINDSTKA